MTIVANNLFCLITLVYCKNNGSLQQLVVANDLDDPNGTAGCKEDGQTIFFTNDDSIIWLGVGRPVTKRETIIFC